MKSNFVKKVAVEPDTSLPALYESEIGNVYLVTDDKLILIHTNRKVCPSTDIGKIYENHRSRHLDWRRLSNEETVELKN